MGKQLLQFDIKGLYGLRDYEIRFKDNRLVIVGENGSGKTTVFKIMYHTLACDWDALIGISFEQVRVVFDGEEPIEISAELLRSARQAGLGIPMPYYRDRRGVFTLDETPINTGLKAYYDDIYDVIYSAAPNMHSSGKAGKSIKTLKEIEERIKHCFDAMILCLPTYRRIEEQLESLFPNMERAMLDKLRQTQRHDEYVTELVEFGMHDVEDMVAAFQQRLSTFSLEQQNEMTQGYLGEIIGKTYEQFAFDRIRDLKEYEIGAILDRIDKSILKDRQKKAVVNSLAKIQKAAAAPDGIQEQIICHYFLKLLDLDSNLQEQEAPMLRFTQICNKYLVSNKLRYNSKDFSCKVYSRTGKQKGKSDSIPFQYLSSGEKQIVSLFSHLNLSERKSLFVFIDEPELSLSVDWQRMLLADVIHSENCVGLFAATHSPFVFENELDPYVHGLNEFKAKRR